MPEDDPCDWDGALPPWPFELVAPNANEKSFTSLDPPVGVMVREPAAPRMPPPMPSKPGTSSTEGVFVMLRALDPEGELVFESGSRIDAGEMAEGE